MNVAGQIIAFLAIMVLMVGVGNTFRAWRPDMEPETRRARYIAAISGLVGIGLMAAAAALLKD